MHLGKRHKRWTQWTHFSEYHRLHASPSPHVQLTLLSSAPTSGSVHAAHRCIHGGMRRCISSAWWLFFFFSSSACLLACLLLVVTKCRCTSWRERVFASGLRNPSFAQVRSAVRRKKLINGIAARLAATVLGVVGWKALRHFPPSLQLCHCFSGERFTCLPASGHAPRLACSRCLSVPVCYRYVDGSLSDFLSGLSWVRPQ